MTNRLNLIFFTPEDLIVLYLGFYNQEYGNKKAVEIISKIESSKKIQEFIAKLRVERLSPGPVGFITLVNSLPYFFFSKSETLCYGSLLAITEWQRVSANDEFQLGYTSIHNIIVETIFKAERLTKINPDSPNSFFNKFYRLLEEVRERTIQNLSQESTNALQESEPEELIKASKIGATAIYDITDPTLREQA